MADIKIEDNRVVTLDYSLWNQEGELIDSSSANGALEYLHGYQAIMPGLEKALNGKQAGSEIDVTLTGDDAYGDYDPGLVFEVSRTEFPDGLDLYEGFEFEAEIKDQIRFCTVEKLSDSGQVKINANHPLAGQKLRVKANVLAVRTATDEEIEHGHVHSGDHHHH